MKSNISTEGSSRQETEDLLRTAPRKYLRENALAACRDCFNQTTSGVYEAIGDGENGKKKQEEFIWMYRSSLNLHVLGEQIPEGEDKFNIEDFSSEDFDTRKNAVIKLFHVIQARLFVSSDIPAGEKELLMLEYQRMLKYYGYIAPEYSTMLLQTLKDDIFKDANIKNYNGVAEYITLENIRLISSVTMDFGEKSFDSFCLKYFSGSWQKSSSLSYRDIIAFIRKSLNSSKVPDQIPGPKPINSSFGIDKSFGTTNLSQPLDRFSRTLSSSETITSFNLPKEVNVFKSKLKIHPANSNNLSNTMNIANSNNIANTINIPSQPLNTNLSAPSLSSEMIIDKFSKVLGKKMTSDEVAEILQEETIKKANYANAIMYLRAINDCWESKFKDDYTNSCGEWTSENRIIFHPRNWYVKNLSLRWFRNINQLIENYHSQTIVDDRVGLALTDGSYQDFLYAILLDLTRRMVIPKNYESNIAEYFEALFEKPIYLDGVEKIYFIKLISSIPHTKTLDLIAQLSEVPDVDTLDLNKLLSDIAVAKELDLTKLLSRLPNAKILDLLKLVAKSPNANTLELTKLVSQVFNNKLELKFKVPDRELLNYILTCSKKSGKQDKSQLLNQTTNPNDINQVREGRRINKYSEQVIGEFLGPNYLSQIRSFINDPDKILKKISDPKFVYRIHA